MTRTPTVTPTEALHENPSPAAPPAEPRVRGGAGLSPGRARDALIVAHRPLVRSTARRYARNGIPFEDLEAEGFVGLLEAARRFDPSRGTTFGTYARWWVRVSIERYVMANRRIVTTPQTRAVRRLARIRRAERALEQQGRPADSTTIARAVSLQPKQVQEARDLMACRDVRARVTANEGWEVPADGPTPEEEAAAHEWELSRLGLARTALDVLDRRERAIIEGRLLRYRPRTLEALGKRFGISRERVRQIEARALGKMREALSSAAAA